MGQPQRGLKENCPHPLLAGGSPADVAAMKAEVACDAPRVLGLPVDPTSRALGGRQTPSAAKQL